eukprot:UN28208
MDVEVQDKDTEMIDNTDNKKEISNREIYHICIMPCFDKKLEATRKQFRTETERDVDLVITPIELFDYMDENKIEFNKLEKQNILIYGPIAPKNMV